MHLLLNIPLGMLLPCVGRNSKMSASGFSSTRERSWLQRPIHHEHVPLRSSKARVPLELALLTVTLAVLAFTFL